MESCSPRRGKGLASLGLSVPRFEIHPFRGLGTAEERGREGAARGSHRTRVVALILGAGPEPGKAGLGNRLQGTSFLDGCRFVFGSPDTHTLSDAGKRNPGILLR